MEQEVDFKRLMGVLGELEQASLSGDQLVKMKDSAVQAVEDEFEKCMNALAARKQSLLNEIDLKFQSEKEKQEQTIAIAIKGCKDLLQVGSTIYKISKEAAVGTWQNAILLKPKISNAAKISVTFPASMLDGISKHGSLEFQSPTAQAISNAELSQPPANQDSLKAGAVSTLASNAQGNNQNLKFSAPWFGCWNPADNCFYLSDYGNNVIKKITLQGVVTLFSERIANPAGICIYHKDNCFFACSSSHHSVLKISNSGKISTLAGCGRAGSTDGIGKSASFNYPRGIAVDQQTGVLFIADSRNHMIRKITPDGKVSTLAGSGDAGYIDGVGEVAKFGAPNGIWLDKDSLTICDTRNNKLRRLNIISGEVSTICHITSPFGISRTPSGSYIVSSFNEHKVMLVTQNSSGIYEVKTLAGSGIEGSDDGDPSTCKFNHPMGISYDPNTNTCFVVDSSNDRVRKFALVTLQN